MKRVLNLSLEELEQRIAASPTPAGDHSPGNGDHTPPQDPGNSDWGHRAAYENSQGDGKGGGLFGDPDGHGCCDPK